MQFSVPRRGVWTFPLLVQLLFLDELVALQVLHCSKTSFSSVQKIPDKQSASDIIELSTALDRPPNEPRLVVRC